MTPTELKQAMEQQGLSNNDLATITGKTSRQVTSWLSATHPVPRLVAIIMHGLRDDAINRDWLLEVVCHELRQEADAAI
jgi:hypothetical protein